MIQFHLPLPPSRNHSHRNATAFCKKLTAGGRYVRKRYTRQIKTNEASAWLSNARILALSQAAVSQWRMPQKTVKLILEIIVFWPDNRRRDADNLIKLTQDALTGAIWVDDKMVMPRVMDIRTDKEEPRLELKIYPEPQPQQKKTEGVTEHEPEKKP